jgi:hypothetical protein
MGTLRCDGCGEEFFIGHNPQSVDKRVAEKQAQWLERVLAEEHERDRKHPDRIELPDWPLPGKRGSGPNGRRCTMIATLDVLLGRIVPQCS